VIRFGLKGEMKLFRKIKFAPMTKRRMANFKANKRGYRSLWIFVILLLITLPAEFLSNDKPLLVRYNHKFYMPIFRAYPETEFGGMFETETDFTDPVVADDLIKDQGGWIIWPLIRYSYDTVDDESIDPVPTAPSSNHWLGTDGQGRDVMARVIYGFRISVLFGFTLTAISTIIGVLMGLWQGYKGGWVDLIMQRIMELWGSMPSLYLLIIMSSFIAPSFFTLLCLLLFFSWMSLVGVVRAETLRARNFEYVKAARALGMSGTRIAMKHILPNAIVATLTFLPFILAGSLITLTSLDFLGLGLPPGSPSLGELLQQGKANLYAPWLGISAFMVLAVMFSLVVFIGEAVRDAFDPRKAV
jgi:microcin C transport system permease protein